MKAFGRKCEGLIEILSQHLPGWTDENHAKLYSI
jgi:hypothetical protein